MRTTGRQVFKLQVLRELEEGRFVSYLAVVRAYGIRSMGTIAYWSREFQKQHLLKKVSRVETAIKNETFLTQRALGGAYLS